MSGIIFTFTLIISVSPQNKPEHNEIILKSLFEPWNHPLQKSTERLLKYGVIGSKAYWTPITCNTVYEVPLTYLPKSQTVL